MFHLAKTAPYLTNDVMFVLHTLQCWSWLSLHRLHSPKSIHTLPVETPLCFYCRVFIEDIFNSGSLTAESQ